MPRFVAPHVGTLFVSVNTSASSVVAMTDDLVQICSSTSTDGTWPKLRDLRFSFYVTDPFKGSTLGTVQSSFVNAKAKCDQFPEVTVVNIKTVPPESVKI